MVPIRNVAQFFFFGCLLGLVVQPQGWVFFLPTAIVSGLLLWYWKCWPFNNRSKSPAKEGSTAEEQAHYEELASQKLLAKSKDYTDEERDALLESYRGAINATPEMVELANRLKMAYAEAFQYATLNNLIRDGSEREASNFQSPPIIEPHEIRTAEALNELADVLSGGICQTFSVSSFTDLFKDESFSQGWTLRDALVVWYSPGHFALVVAAWRAYNEKTRVFRIVDLCRPLLLKRWNLSEDMFEQLRTVVNETEAEAIASFTSCKSGVELSRFFHRYVSRILGAAVPFSERSTFEDEMLGIKYQRSNPILEATVCRLFVGNCGPTKALLEKISI